MICRVATRNGEISFWWRDIGGLPALRPPLTTSRDVDVVIIGAGYTGLWTAYYLLQHEPGLKIAIVEAEFAGFGASGRNGGWLTGEFSWSGRHYAQSHDASSMRAFIHELQRSVDEVIEVAHVEGIDADIVHSGAFTVATSMPQLQRLPTDELRLEPAALRARIHIPAAVGASWTPHAARIQPAKLVRGLADVVEQRGALLYEGTRALRIEPHCVTTEHGRITATHVIRATEGFTSQLPGHARDWLPMNSAMIVTRPLTDHEWDDIGWSGCELLGDAAHAYIYAQRTREGRIALGGRGIPYRFGSGLDQQGRTQRQTVELLRGALIRLWPQLVGIDLDHAWCGVLAVPRDWCATVGLDPKTGIGWAGGYVGTGVAASNLAARSLRSLILDPQAVEGRLPWINRRVRRWEPEPLRWLGVQGLYALYRGADARERTATRTSEWAQWASRLAGRD